MVEALAEVADDQQKKEYIAETIEFSPLDAAHVSSHTKCTQTDERPTIS